MAPHASILAWRTLWTEAWWATVHGVATELDTTEATEHTRTPHAQASALPAAAPGTALGGFLLYSVARNLWFGDRGVFSQAACLDDDPPRSHPALPSSAKTGSLGGIFFFKARNSRKISLPLLLVFPL